MEIGDFILNRMVVPIVCSEHVVLSYCVLFGDDNMIKSKIMGILLLELLPCVLLLLMTINVNLCAHFKVKVSTSLASKQ